MYIFECVWINVINNLMLLEYWEVRDEVGRGKEIGCEKFYLLWEGIEFLYEMKSY